MFQDGRHTCTTFGRAPHLNVGLLGFQESHVGLRLTRTPCWNYWALFFYVGISGHHNGALSHRAPPNTQHWNIILMDDFQVDYWVGSYKYLRGAHFYVSQIIYIAIATSVLCDYSSLVASSILSQMQHLEDNWVEGSQLSIKQMKHLTHPVEFEGFSLPFSQIYGIQKEPLQWGGDKY